MAEHAVGTLTRARKGVLAPPPILDAPLKTVADAVASWPGVIATAHWDLFDPSRLDGADFYVGEAELGHIHLDGSLHLASSPSLGKALVSEGLAVPFPYLEGWVCEAIQRIGSEAGIALFQRNYQRLIKANRRHR